MAPPETGLKTNLISCWEPTNGSTLYDKHSSNDGYIYGINYANNELYFDGSTSDYVNLLSPASLEPSSQLTVSLWFNPSSLSGPTYGQRYIINRWYASTAELQIMTRINGGAWQFYIYTSNNAQIGGTFTGVDAPAINQWFHFVVVADGSYLRMYINGTESSTTYAYDGTLKTGQTQNLYVGARLTPSPGFIDNFHGYMKQVAMWNAGISSEYIGILNNSGVILPYSQW